MKQQFVPFNEQRSRAGEPVMMKNGTPIVRVLAYDMKTPGYPILATYYNERGIEVAESFTKKGEYNLHGSCGEGGMDLVMAPTKVVVWIGAYHGSEAKGLTAGAYFYGTKEKADDSMRGDQGYIGAFAVEVTIQPENDAE